MVLSDNRASLPTIFEYTNKEGKPGTSRHIHSPCTHTHTVNSDVFEELEVMKEVFGGSRLYFIPNILPLVGDLQEAEFDVQVGHVIVM